MKFTIYVDADSCPKAVRNQIVSRGKHFALPVVFVANRVVDAGETEGASRDATVAGGFQMIVVPSTEGAADDKIMELAKENDIVVTRDIPLAARLIEKKVTVMNDRGTIFTDENIGEKLSQRNFNLNLLELGLEKKKKSSYGEREFKKFCDCFERVVSQRVLM